MSNPPRLFTGLVEEALPDIALGRPLRQIPTLPAPTKAPVDLNGKPVILLAIGAGNSGKTSYLRWVAEMALARDPNCQTIFAALGTRRDLTRYPFTVSEPTDAAGQRVDGDAKETKWFSDLLAHCMKDRVGAAIDFDGGDASLTGMVRDHEDLVDMISAAGLAVVAAYLLTPRLSDLDELVTLEDAGFQPPTMLILNDGTGSETEAFDAKFAAVRRHPAFVRAQERGAVVLRMPRLHAARAVELRRLLFAQAGATTSPLHAFDRSRVAGWLEAMAEAFRPVMLAGWLP